MWLEQEKQRSVYALDRFGVMFRKRLGGESKGWMIDSSHAQR